MQAKGAKRKRGASKAFLPTAKQSTLSPEQRQITSFFGQGRQATTPGTTPGKTPVKIPSGSEDAPALVERSKVLNGPVPEGPIDLEATSLGSQEGDARQPAGKEGQR